MKKKFFLFCIATTCLLYSCDNDDTDNTPYLNNKLIEGTWIGTLKNDYYTLDSTIYIFKDNKMCEKYYAHISGLDTLKYEGKSDYGNYRLTDTLILVSQPTDKKFIYKFNNNKDTLYLANAINKPLDWHELKKLKE